MMTVQPYQYDPHCNHICITFIHCVQLALYVDGRGASIDTQILKHPHILLEHLAALENKINPDIGTLKKERGDIFS